MQPTNLTRETAPRNASELARTGRLNLRNLAEDLGLFTDEVTKAKFSNLPTVEYAELVSAKLRELDGDKSRSTAAPEACAVRTPAVRVRTPRAAAPAVAPPNRDADPPLAEAVQELTRAVERLTDRVEDLEQSAGGTNRLIATALVVELMLAEELLGQGRDRVLGLASTNVPGVVELLQRLATNPGLEIDASANNKPGAR